MKIDYVKTSIILTALVNYYKPKYYNIIAKRYSLIDTEETKIEMLKDAQIVKIFEFILELTTFMQEHEIEYYENLTQRMKQFPIDRDIITYGMAEYDEDMDEDDEKDNFGRNLTLDQDN